MNKSKNEKKLIKAEKLRLKELDKKQIAEQKARGDHVYTPVFAKLIRKLVRDNKAKKNVISQRGNVNSPGYPANRTKKKQTPSKKKRAGIK